MGLNPSCSLSFIPSLSVSSVSYNFTYNQSVPWMNFITNRHVAASITFLPGSKKGQPFIAICLNLLYFLSCKVLKVHLYWQLRLLWFLWSPNSIIRIGFNSDELWQKLQCYLNVASPTGKWYWVPWKVLQRVTLNAACNKREEGHKSITCYLQLSYTKPHQNRWTFWSSD